VWPAPSSCGSPAKPILAAVWPPYAISPPDPARPGPRYGRGGGSSRGSPRCRSRSLSPWGFRLGSSGSSPGRVADDDGCPARARGASVTGAPRNCPVASARACQSSCVGADEVAGVRNPREDVTQRRKQDITLR
jgi:hypothetical protein